MPNKKEHQAISCAVGGLTYLLAKRAQNEPPNLGTLILSVFGGVVAGDLPDTIEPAYSANHRSTAHSWTAAGGVAYMTKHTWEHPELNNEQKAFFTALGMAYLSHLLVDSETPAGLPLL